MIASPTDFVYRQQPHSNHYQMQFQCQQYDLPKHSPKRGFRKHPFKRPPRHIGRNLYNRNPYWQTLNGHDSKAKPPADDSSHQENNHPLDIAYYVCHLIIYPPGFRATLKHYSARGYRFQNCLNIAKSFGLCSPRS